MDIQATGRGFGQTQATFTAITRRGKEAMGKLFGFATIEVSLRKSSVGQAQDLFTSEGAEVTWVP